MDTRCKLHISLLRRLAGTLAARRQVDEQNAGALMNTGADASAYLKRAQTARAALEALVAGARIGESDAKTPPNDTTGKTADVMVTITLDQSAVGELVDALAGDDALTEALGAPYADALVKGIMARREAAAKAMNDERARQIDEAKRLIDHYAARRGEPMTYAQAAKDTGIAASHVSSIVRRLKIMGVIVTGIDARRHTIIEAVHPQAFTEDKFRIAMGWED